MKKDFTQPFKQLENTILILPVVLNDHQEPLQKKVVLQKMDRTFEGASYASMNFEIGAVSDLTLEIAKYLFSKGLLLNRLVKLTEDTRVNYSFIDNTEGSTETRMFYFAEVEVAEKRQDLAYVAFDVADEIIMESAFADNVERAAFAILSDYV